jgi:hypothetical protein
MITNWKIAAQQEAAKNQVDLDVVLSTIEAETNGVNKLGDNGNAMGYGQVWSKWHMAQFQEAARELNLVLPTTFEGLQQFVLANDEFSMAVTVKVIKKVWTYTHKDWSAFTHAYVGPAIPDSDFLRREKIWFRYHNNSADNNLILENRGVANNSNIPSYNYGFDVNAPAINYQVKSGSLVKTDYLYGRRYRVLVSQSGQTALDVSNLHVTFVVQKTMLMQPNYSEITIYNLNAETENSIIQEGYRVVIEAGYEGDQYGVIFDGDVLQAIRGKENGNTYTLTLVCLDSDRFMNFGFANFTILRGQTSRDISYNIINKAKIPSQFGSISESLNNTKLTRGKVVFGLAKDYLRQIAQSHKATFYTEDGKVNIVTATDLPKEAAIELSPKSGLIDMPSQYEYGVQAKCLLNPRIRPNTFVHIDNSLIRAKRVELNQIVRSLDADGIYRVMTITYTGDNRGNDWYCEFEAINQSGILPNMIQYATINPW